jgi:hypothetical protein
MVGAEVLVAKLMKTAAGRFIAACLLLALGLFFLAAGWPDLEDAKNLRANREVITALVIETRVNHGMHFETTYDLRYRFKPLGSDRWFTRGERGTNRSDIWSAFPKDQWLEAQRTGMLNVVYLPAHPEINRPLSQASGNLWTERVIVIMASAMVGGAMLWISVMIVRLLKLEPVK